MICIYPHVCENNDLYISGCATTDINRYKQESASEYRFTMLWYIVQLINILGEFTVKMYLNILFM